MRCKMELQEKAKIQIQRYCEPRSNDGKNKLMKKKSYYLCFGKISSCYKLFLVKTFFQWRLFVSLFNGLKLGGGAKKRD